MGRPHLARRAGQALCDIRLLGVRCPGFFQASPFNRGADHGELAFAGGAHIADGSTCLGGNVG
jgi:hypothetical protein